MIDAPFISGLILGAIATAAIAGSIMVTAYRPRVRRHDPIEWREEGYQPPVVTNITINKRTFEL